MNIRLYKYEDRKTGADYNLGKCLVWVNPNLEESVKMVLKMDNKRHHRMHVFITNPGIIKGNVFKRFIEAFFYNPFDIPTLTIHIHHSMPDFREVLEKVIIHDLDSMNAVKENRIKIVAERRGASFIFPNDKHRHLDFIWRDDNKLDIRVSSEVYNVGGYDGPFRKFGGKPGAVKNWVQAWFPETFKDKIIASFKESCPENILKSFKTDDEIWAFINQEGEWSVKEEI